MAKIQNPDQLALSDPALLDRIDKLFACNVGEYISLPQLVVVGDQSSGKSSVLEGLTRLPFPRDSGLCTRFATQIIFRRSKEHPTRTITASVLPGPDASTEKAAALKEWTWRKDGTFDSNEFSDVMNEVHALMGVSLAPNGAKSTFSNDVFRLEICGPDEDHLSVIDVPGIFKNTVPGVTSKADIQLVHNMVVGYMKNPRSIMLMVVPANVDIATQEIVELAREYDPDGQRTLGVLTKPDLVDTGAEQRVLGLIHGEDLTFKQGWFLVRNLGQRELQEGGVDRNAAEDEFRQTEPWNLVPQDRFGIQSLRLRLQEVVIHNARQAFSQVRSEIMKRLKSRQQSLKDLGDERITSEQQRSFLLGAVSRFQEITSHGLNSNYAMDNVFDDNPDLRIATLVMNCHVAFAERLSSWANEYRFSSQKDTNDFEDEQAPQEAFSEWPYEEPNNDSATRDQESTNISNARPDIHTRTTEDIEELTEILHESTLERYPNRSGIYQWLTEVFHLSRGFEMGTFNPSILAEVFRKQSAKWPNFALGYISDVITLVHRFILKALELSCVNQRVCDRLKARLINDLLSKYRNAMKMVFFLLRIERNGTPLTLNHYFNDKLQRRRAARIQAHLAPKVISDHKRGEIVRLSDVSAAHNKSNTRQTVEDIHDILQSYYKAALKRFADNVCMQAADFYLVHGPETPTKLFNPLFVHKLSSGDLEEIAGEEPRVRRLRAQLVKEIRDLEAGKKILL
ncbi:dynamin family protein [Aspergillus candidus]|uniref:P-loop containing nucleoside triphosphate hydrolase protein n=1 Tax=Aspergillus candidus TaxID=41067 RepID=A0A2I2FGZ8_ASPCN|nr:P-loop containing nucleoside triphosphate hydrolase protein [Aspergillus candidus]PLB39905.1 P-loop containing nucleoside triphosphate hydrolase protein [Aspergillus candidus]